LEVAPKTRGKLQGGINRALTEKLQCYETLLADHACDPASTLDRISTVLYGKRFPKALKYAQACAAERARIVDNDGPAVLCAAASVRRRVDIRSMLGHVKCPTTVLSEPKTPRADPKRRK